MGPLEYCPSIFDAMSIPRSRHLYFLPDSASRGSSIFPSSAFHERCAGMEQPIHALAPDHGCFGAVASRRLEAID